MNESKVQCDINRKDNPHIAHIAIMEHNPMRKTINEVVMELCNTDTKRFDKEVTLQKPFQLGEER